MKTFICIALSVTAFCSALWGQTFKGHKVGETANEFFAIAMMAENHGPTEKFCADFLNNPKNRKRDNWLGFKPDLEQCMSVQSALAGGNAKVGARYAIEIGPGGEAVFHDGKLVALSILVGTNASFDAVVTDVTKELGGVIPVKRTGILQNAFGAKLEVGNAIWVTKNLFGAAEEQRDFQYGYMGVHLTFATPDYLQMTKEIEASRPNTIH